MTKEQRDKLKAVAGILKAEWANEPASPLMQVQPNVLLSLLDQLDVYEKTLREIVNRGYTGAEWIARQALSLYAEKEGR